MAPMAPRILLSGLGLVTALCVWLVPWAAINRETGSRSALLLLPDRVLDFTGRTGPIVVEGMTLVFILTLIGAGLLLISGLLRGAGSRFVWLAAGLLLIGASSFGLGRFNEGVDQARFETVLGTIQSTVENPRPVHDVPALEALLAEADQLELAEVLSASEAGGLLIRRLPYANSGPALAMFMAVVSGIIALVYGFTFLPAWARMLDRAIRAAAVPAVSILLALFASGVVILLLQPTPMGTDVAGGLSLAERFAGRMDTVWYAFFTLFSGSLATFPGFLEALKFSTPLIFVGLALAFGFRAGLFNIGAPGQMTLGGIFAMLAGLYMPGPMWVVLPVAILAAAVGGALWGIVPGWLKAQFGASEVISTIMMNYIAASLLLFLLSSNPTFAAPALAALRFLGIATAVLIVLLLIPPVRRLLSARPRLSVAATGVVLLGGMLMTGLPEQGNPPVVMQMPFKAPGSEPKSYPLQLSARLPQLPSLLGINLSETPGVNTVRANAAALIGPVVGLLALLLIPRRRLKAFWQRLIAAAAIGAAAWGLALLFGLGNLPMVIPPTTLNVSFLLAIGAAFFMQFLLWRTHWGFDLRAVGVAPKAAEYGGANIKVNTILTMAISGAFAGLTATHYVLGGALEEYSLRQSLPVNDGFDGIAVALLGANTPLGVVLSAFLFGVLKNGGSALNVAFSSLTRDVVSMILALVVLFIAARGFLPARFSRPPDRVAVAAAQTDDPHSVDPVTATGGKEDAQ